MKRLQSCSNNKVNGQQTELLIFHFKKTNHNCKHSCVMIPQ